MKGHGAKIQPRGALGRHLRGHAAALAERARVPKSHSEARRAAFGQAITRMQMSGAAVATLAKMMVEQGAPPSTGFGPRK